jgi:proteasome lid subunit RPN8/RPN11
MISNDAIACYPLECCGLLVGKINSETKEIWEVIPTENDWENQKQLFQSVDISLDDRQCDDSFSINPVILLTTQKKAREENLDIIGIYHSHPNHEAIPSAFDTKFAWAKYSYVIVSVRENKINNIRSWILNDDGHFIEEKIEIIDSETKNR